MMEIFEAILPFGYVDEPYLGPSPDNKICPVCEKVVRFGNLADICLWVVFVESEEVVDIFIHDGCRSIYSNHKPYFCRRQN